MANGNILIVEDEGVIARFMEITLTQLGYCVTGIAHSGEQAIEMVTKTPPDLLLMDIKLKGKMDGIETAKKIIRATGVPVIYVTAFVQQSIRDTAMLTNPCDYIVKPFTPKRLIEAVGKALGEYAPRNPTAF